MDNTEQLLASLQNDLRYYADYLLGLTRELLDAGVSKYPIFIAYTEAVAKLGKPVLLKQDLSTLWSINMTALEELIHKNVVPRAQVNTFRQHYKDPEYFMCVFVAHSLFTGFIYMPYESEENTQDHVE